MSVLLVLIPVVIAVYSLAYGIAVRRAIADDKARQRAAAESGERPRDPIVRAVR